MRISNSLKVPKNLKARTLSDFLTLTLLQNIKKTRRDDPLDTLWRTSKVGAISETQTAQSFQK